jgi:two-component system sensor histidine kinase QseC
VFFGVRLGLRPLDRLRRQLPGISGRTISTRLSDARIPRELAPIYRELNEMLERMERALERERSFADATAHELRTPLAELRATAEVAIRWPEPDRAISSLHEVLAIGHEMERLVESLLLISHGREQERAAELPEVPVSPIIGRLLEREAGTIHAKDLGVNLDVADSASMQAPAEAIEIILRNLINNAVHYTPAGGRIGVRAQSHNGSAASVLVENDPVTLRESDLPLLFRPFWRADGSRTDRAHAGLGLAVVQQIAQATGLEVAASLAGDRLAIRVTESQPNGSSRS